MRLSLLALLLAGGLVCGPAPVPVRAQTPPPSQGPLDANPPLFTALAAINAAGYDADLDSPSNHPLRMAVRQAVAARKPPSLERLKKLFQARRAWNWNAELGQYISYALSVSGPPDFKPKFSPNRMPPDTVALEGLSPVLADFYREAGIEDLWQRSQPAFEEVIGRYHEQTAKAIFEANMYLRNPTSGMAGRRFQVIIDLLGAPNQVHTRSFADDYYVVVTHGPRARIEEIRHAYLHYLLDPLAIRFQQHLEPKRGLGDLAHGSPLLNEAYKNDFVLLAGMSAVLTPFVSFAFAVLSKGAQKIESGFQWSDPPVNIDRSLVRVLQSTIVLMVVLAFGVRNRFFPPRSAQPVTDDDEEVART